MTWRFRKIFSSGPFRTTWTKNGIGYSVGIPGLRYGISPDGRKYVSIGIPGTGIYWIKYFNPSLEKTTTTQAKKNKNQHKTFSKTVNNNNLPWWKQKGLKG